jgi:hypothetical protein
MADPAQSQTRSRADARPGTTSGEDLLRVHHPGRAGSRALSAPRTAKQLRRNSRMAGQHPLRIEAF